MEEKCTFEKKVKDQGFKITMCILGRSTMELLSSQVIDVHVKPVFSISFFYLFFLILFVFIVHFVHLYIHRVCMVSIVHPSITPIT
jgi:hypothetical protein